MALASISLKWVKTGVIVGIIPAAALGLGYRTRSIQAKERAGDDQRQVYRACDLPFYAVNNRVTDNADIYPRNAVEAQIGDVRRYVQNVMARYQGTYDKAHDKYSIGVEHSKSSLDYIQNSPNEVARVVSIALAGSLGYVLGHKGTIYRKTIFASIAASTMAALAYPKQAVYITEAGYGLLTSVLPEMPKIPALTSSPNEQATKAIPEEASLPVSLSGDPGQSNPEDSDMYSTRSS